MKRVKMENERKAEAERDEKIERKMERIIIDLANIIILFSLAIARIHFLLEMLTQFHHKCCCIFFCLIDHPASYNRPYE